MLRPAGLGWVLAGPLRNPVPLSLVTLVPGSEERKRKRETKETETEKKTSLDIGSFGGVEANPPPRRPNRKTPITTSDIVGNCFPVWDPVLGPELEVFRPGGRKRMEG